MSGTEHSNKQDLLAEFQSKRNLECLPLELPNSVSHLGTMVGMTPLSRLLPETSKDKNGFFISEDEDGGVTSFPALGVIKGSVVLVSDSGIMIHMFSSCRTTSAIEGLESVSSSQHLRAKVKNFSTQSEGYDPIRPSMTEKIVPDWNAVLTLKNETICQLVRD